VSSGDGVERELKFRCPDLAGLRDRLIELEAERLRPSSFEDNVLFDEDDRLKDEGLTLRLRVEAHRSRLTYKGPAHFEGSVKVRDEIEIEVSDSEDTQKIFEALGYKISRRYQKHREEWHLGGVTISLDHTPIGDYAEFEGAGAETVARRTGFKADEAERRTYIQLYDDWHEENPDSPAEMVFPS